MNILVLFGHGNKPGLLRLLLAVEKRLSMKGHRIYYAIDLKNDSFLNYGFDENSVCRVKDLKRKGGFLSRIYKGGGGETLQKFCELNAVNIVLSYTLSTLPRALELSFESKIPCATWLHNDYPDAAARYGKYGLEKNGNIIAVSNFILDGVKDYLGNLNKNLQVAYNAIDTENFLSQADNLEYPDVLNSIGKDDFVIGMIAAMDANKNPQLLLRAFACLKNALAEKKIKVVFAGRFPDKDYESETKKLAHQLGVSSHVLFAGFQSNVSAIFRRLDLFVYPSFRDACPLSPMEAMAWGKPVIASRTGGIPEIVEDGVTGILCEPGNVDHFATAVRRLVEDHNLRNQMGKRGKERLEKMFTMDHLADNVEKLLMEASKK